MAPPPRAAAQKSTKDTLSVVAGVHQATLDPHFAITTQDLIFNRNIYNALVKFKPNSIEFEPDLATSWTVSKDGLEYTFKLRRDVEWHKGYGKFTAADVKGSFDRLLDPSTKSPFAGSMRMLKEAVVVGRLHGEARPQGAVRRLPLSAHALPGGPDRQRPGGGGEGSRATRGIPSARGPTCSRAASRTASR